MTFTSQEAEEAAKKLVDLTMKQNELSEQIKDIKAQLIEFTEVENMSDWSCAVDNGYVEIKTEVKYKLSEIPFETKVDSDACPTDVAEQAFTTRLVLTKEGKQMLKEQYPTLMELMIPTNKKSLKVLV